MAISLKKALEQGQRSIERPKGRMEITLYHGRGGLTLRYEGRVIARTHASRVGRLLAPFLAEALGVGLPQPGDTAKAVVSSGVMFRVLSISSLDLRVEEAALLLNYLLHEAEEMRGFGSSSAE